MDKLDKELRRMSKIEPPRRFMQASRNRLMEQIVLHQNESWLKAFLKKIGRAVLPAGFTELARARLMYRINHIPQPVRVSLTGMARFLVYTKRAVASTLVMLIAVTSTLFFVEGNTVVEASDTSYLEVVAGQASIKHPDLIVWEDINGLIEVRSGDLIRVGEDSEVIIRFFDDTEIRVGENSEFLISQLGISPAFGRQGIIEIALHKGTAWAQTLNVEDGYAVLTLSTRDAIIKALNSAFYVKTEIGKPSSVFVFSNKVTLTSLSADTRGISDSIKLSANQKASIHAVSGGRTVITTSVLDQQDRTNAWVQNNLLRDQNHLTALREKGIERLEQMAGTLPGHMLYPIKQTKERLRLAFSAGSGSELQIEIANRRLSEALVLFEAGDQEKGREAIVAYQNMVRQIAEDRVAKQLTQKLIVPHQKTLIAELPNDAATGLVKEALHQTAEILIEDPIELEKMRLVNSVQRLEDVVALIKEGSADAARERLASYQLAASYALSATETMEDEAMKKQILQDVLELRQEELLLLGSLSEVIPTEEGYEDLTVMVASASEAAEEEVEMVLAAVAPFLPEPQDLPVQLSAAEIKMAELIEKIYIYNSWTGQQNQIKRLLKNELEDPANIDYLISVRDHLSGRAYDYLNIRILQLQRMVELQKHKMMERKIEEAKMLREI